MRSTVLFALILLAGCAGAPLSGGGCANVEVTPFTPDNLLAYCHVDQATR